MHALHCAILAAQFCPILYLLAHFKPKSKYLFLCNLHSLQKKPQKNQGLFPIILEVIQAPTLAMAIKNVGRIIYFKKSIHHLIQYLENSSTKEQEVCGKIFSISNGVKN
jgi:hypothetical protein